jgi:hypothetical protein
MSAARATSEVDLAARIYNLRGLRVMLDSDLARIYGVSTTRLNEQFRRNRKRFPDDFAFELTYEEFDSLMSQIARSKKGRGGRRKPPVVFTEHGAIMLASILNSSLAVEASVRVVRAFIYVRELLSKNHELKSRLNEIELRVSDHDSALKELFEAFRELLDAPDGEKPAREIGFHVKDSLLQTKHII